MIARRSVRLFLVLVGLVGTTAIQSQRLYDELGQLIVDRNWAEAGKRAEPFLRQPSPIPGGHPVQPLLRADTLMAFASLSVGSEPSTLQERALLNNVGVSLALQGQFSAATAAFRMASRIPTRSLQPSASALDDQIAFLSLSALVDNNRELTARRERKALGSSSWINVGYATGSALGEDLRRMLLFAPSPHEVLRRMAAYYPAWVASRLGDSNAASDMLAGYEQFFSEKAQFTRELQRRVKTTGAIRSAFSTGRDAAEVAAGLIKQRDKAAERVDTLSNFRLLLDPDEAFVDVFRIERQIDSSFPDHYLAFVIERARASVVDLGPSPIVERGVSDWQADVAVGTASIASLRGLAKSHWQPIAAALDAEVKRVWLAPDGLLTLVPWQALEVGSATTSSRTITQIDSASGFAELRRRAAAPVGRDVLVMGGIDYGGDGSPHWQPLPGSLVEARLVQSIVTENGLNATLVTGKDATKAALTGKLARIVHLATHGVFRGPLERPAILTLGPWALIDASSFRSSQAGTPMGTALEAQAAVILAGANGADPFVPDANTVLSDLDIGGLDLARVDLLVLSGCDTGRRGTLGYQGLPSFQIAALNSNARTVMTSLWPVPDNDTGPFMRDFYSALLRDKQNKAESLRTAQLNAYRRNLNPGLWAGWILFGQHQ